MSDDITIQRAVVDYVLNALEELFYCNSTEEAEVQYYKATVALRAALEQPQDHCEQHLNMVPAGWKLVPIEPTLEMSIAFGESFYTKDRCLDDDKISDWWCAMLAAAPQPPVVKESLTTQPQDDQKPVAWAEEIIDYLQAQYDTDGIKELDSGDALIRLEDAIGAVEEVEQRYTHPQPPRQPLTDQQIHDCFQHRHRDKAAERRMITRAIEFAHGITGEQA